VRKRGQSCSLNHVDDGEAEEVGQGRAWRSAMTRCDAEGGGGGGACVCVWGCGTLGGGVRCDGAAEGVANEHEGAGHSNGAHTQNITCESICRYMSALQAAAAGPTEQRRTRLGSSRSRPRSAWCHDRADQMREHCRSRPNRARLVTN
jgi:hypothetical protein